MVRTQGSPPRPRGFQRQFQPSVCARACLCVSPCARRCAVCVCVCVCVCLSACARARACMLVLCCLCGVYRPPLSQRMFILCLPPTPPLAPPHPTPHTRFHSRPHRLLRHRKPVRRHQLRRRRRAAGAGSCRRTPPRTRRFPPAAPRHPNTAPRKAVCALQSRAGSAGTAPHPRPPLAPDGSEAVSLQPNSGRSTRPLCVRARVCARGCVRQCLSASVCTGATRRRRNRPTGACASA